MTRVNPDDLLPKLEKLRNENEYIRPCYNFLYLWHVVYYDDSIKKSVVLRHRC